jgi:hypothetical protein
LLCLSEWLVAGLAYPLSLHLAGVAVPPAAYLHFLASLALCGLIAAAYPFFAVTFLALSAWCPALVRPESVSARDLSLLRRLHQLTWFYLLLAAAVPLLGVAALAFIGSQNQLAMGVLSAGGLVGFGLAFWLCRVIHRDLEALVQALHPAREYGRATMTSEDRASPRTPPDGPK